MASAADRAYVAIRDALAEGRYAPGDRLPEEDLAALTGVSRTPVREALRRLDAEGVVAFVPNRGAHVAAWTDADLDEIFGLRALLEGYGARLAASRITAEQLAALGDLAAQMEAAGAEGDIDTVAERNHRFHRTVLEATGNRRLIDSMTGLVQVSLVHRTFRRYEGVHLQRSMVHHRELLDALAEGDGEWAEAVMHSHVLAARAALTSPGPSNVN